MLLCFEKQGRNREKCSRFPPPPVFPSEWMKIPEEKSLMGLQPVGQGKADANPVYTPIIVDQALAEPVKILDIPLQIGIVPEGKTPAQLNSTLIKTGFQIIS